MSMDGEHINVLVTAGAGLGQHPLFCKHWRGVESRGLTLAHSPGGLQAGDRAVWGDRDWGRLPVRHPTTASGTFNIQHSNARQAADLTPPKASVHSMLNSLIAETTLSFLPLIVYITLQSRERGNVGSTSTALGVRIYLLTVGF